MKKIFIITILSVFIFVLITFLTAEFVGKQSIPYNESVQENLTKVNSVESEIKMVSSPIEDVKNIKQLGIDEPLSFIYPVSGEIGLPYSPNNLVYSQTLKEWITHSGIDIKSKRGTPVFASEEGVIESITETSAKGIEITLSHKDGYKTVYSNLSSKEMVKTGQKVEQGRVISGVGNTSSFEYYEPEHLHFEIYKDNKPLNPIEILKAD